MNPVIRPWRQVFDFSGRATRTEYFLFHLTALFVYFAPFLLFLTLFDARAGREGGVADPNPIGMVILVAIGVLSLAITLAIIIGHLSVSIRRLHDHGEPGIKFLLCFIPVIGIFFFLMMVFSRGHDFDNEYGPDPRSGQEASNPDDLGSVFS